MQKSRYSTPAQLGPRQPGYLATAPISPIIIRPSRVGESVVAVGSGPSRVTSGEYRLPRYLSFFFYLVFSAPRIKPAPDHRTTGRARGRGYTAQPVSLSDISYHGYGRPMRIEIRARMESAAPGLRHVRSYILILLPDRVRLVHGSPRQAGPRTRRTTSLTETA